MTTISSNTTWHTGAAIPPSSAVCPRVFRRTHPHSAQASGRRSRFLRTVPTSLLDTLGTPVGQGVDQRSPRLSPDYSSNSVSVSLARCVFPDLLINSSAVFPGFWFFGALMLITPFRTCDPLDQGRRWSLNISFATWRNEHLDTDEEKAEFIAKFRAAERRWARRCLLASFIMSCFGIAFGAMIYGVLKSTSANSAVIAEPSVGTWTL
jgi:hypothetical protein